MFLTPPKKQIYYAKFKEKLAPMIQSSLIFQQYLIILFVIQNNQQEQRHEYF